MCSLRCARILPVSTAEQIFASSTEQQLTKKLWEVTQDYQCFPIMDKETWCMIDLMCQDGSVFGLG